MEYGDLVMTLMCLVSLLGAYSVTLTVFMMVQLRRRGK